MTHDPLCPWQGYERVPDGVCWHCDLIARVRADDLELFIAWAVNACGLSEEFLRQELPLWRGTAAREVRT